VPIGSTIFSGGIPFMTHTADITSLTPKGGFFIDLTIVMSAGYNDSHDRMLTAAAAITQTTEKYP